MVSWSIARANRHILVLYEVPVAVFHALVLSLPWARPVPMSRNANTPVDNDNGSKPSSLATARETRVLSELAASVHTLESTAQVLDQIAVLTGEAEEKASSSGGGAADIGGKERPAGLESIATKQMALMEELGQWGKLLGGAGNSTTSGRSAGDS